jgi:hypothetical protein
VDPSTGLTQASCFRLKAQAHLGGLTPSVRARPHGETHGGAGNRRPFPPHRLPVRTLVAASVGNAVDWYDGTVFATFLASLLGALLSNTLNDDQLAAGGTIGAWYDLTVAVFGGTAPLVIEWLGEQGTPTGSSGMSPWVPSWRSWRPSVSRRPRARC